MLVYICTPIQTSVGQHWKNERLGTITKEFKNLLQEPMLQTMPTLTLSTATIHLICYTTVIVSVFIIWGKNRKRATYKGASWPVDSCKTRVLFLFMVSFELFVSFFLAILFFSRTGWGRRWGGRWGGSSTVLLSFLLTEK